MTRPQKLSKNRAKVSASDQIALSNSTANAFLGSRRPSWLTSSSPSKPTSTTTGNITPSILSTSSTNINPSANTPSLDPLRIMPSSGSILPSPAPSNEPSPTKHNPQDSPLIKDASLLTRQPRETSVTMSDLALTAAIAPAAATASAAATTSARTLTTQTAMHASPSTASAPLAAVTGRDSGAWASRPEEGADENVPISNRAAPPQQPKYSPPMVPTPSPQQPHAQVTQPPPQPTPWQSSSPQATRSVQQAPRPAQNSQNSPPRITTAVPNSNPPTETPLLSTPTAAPNPVENISPTRYISANQQLQQACAPRPDVQKTPLPADRTVLQSHSGPQPSIAADPARIPFVPSNSEVQTQTSTGPHSRTLINFASYVPFLRDTINKLRETPNLLLKVEKQRLDLLEMASQSNDGFYIIMHQLFCMWSSRREDVYQIFAGIVPGEIDASFRILESILEENATMRADLCLWLSAFPAPFHSMITAPSTYPQNLPQVADFLRCLLVHWENLCMCVIMRQYPLLVDEMISQLRCLSPTLQTVLFVSARRHLGVPDSDVSTEIETIFCHDRTAHQVNPASKTLPYSQFAMLESKNSHLITAYREKVARFRDRLTANSTLASSRNSGQSQSPAQPGPQQSNPTPPLATALPSPASRSQLNSAQKISLFVSQLHAQQPHQHQQHQHQQHKLIAQHSFANDVHHPIPSMLRHVHPQQPLQPGVTAPQSPCVGYAERMQAHELQHLHRSETLQPSTHTLLRQTEIQYALLAQHLPQAQQASQANQPTSQMQQPRSIGQEQQLLTPIQRQTYEQYQKHWQMQQQHQMQQVQQQNEQKWRQYQQQFLKMQMQYRQRQLEEQQKQRMQQTRQKQQEQAQAQQEKVQKNRLPPLQTASTDGRASQQQRLRPSLPSLVQVQPPQIRTPSQPLFQQPESQPDGATQANSAPMVTDGGTSQSSPPSMPPAETRLPASAARNAAPSLDKPIVPPPGHLIPPGEIPHSPSERRATAMSLHQVRQRTPPCVVLPLKVGESSQTRPNRERFYQSVKGMAVGPALASAQSYLYNFNFTVTEAEHGLCATEAVPDGELLPVKLQFEGCLRYRLRCVTATVQGQEVSEAEWAMMATVWPSNIFIKFNDCTVSVRRKSQNGRDLPADLTSMVHVGVNKLHVAIPQPVPATAASQLHVLGVEIIETTSHSHILQWIEQRGTEPESATLEKIKARLAETASEGDSSETVQKTLSVDIADPLSNAIFAVPVRGAGCKHFECFDLFKWLNTRPTKPVAACHHRYKCACPKGQEPTLPEEWRCPICSGDARPWSLRKDGFLTAVRQQLASSGKLHQAKSILVSADGQWQAVMKEGSADDSNSDSPSGPATEPPRKVPRTDSVTTATSSRRIPQPAEVIELD